MPLEHAAADSLRRVFEQAFVVHDIAEPLVSFDDSASAEAVQSYMATKRYEVVGIRESGQTTGYVRRDDLDKGLCREYLRPLDDAQVVSDTLPLRDLILRLRERRRLFVSVFGRVGGIVGRSDLQKPPVRMWLFGVVTLVEMRLSRLIDRHCSDREWSEFLSAGRLAKAEQLLDERTRRNQDLTLLDCLQLSDKAQIVARNVKLRELTRFESRNKLEKAAKMIEKLRNNLAHSQDIITNDWDAIVSLAEDLDRVLDGPPGLAEES